MKKRTEKVEAQGRFISRHAMGGRVQRPPPLPFLPILCPHHKRTNGHGVTSGNGKGSDFSDLIADEREQISARPSR